MSHIVFVPAVLICNVSEHDVLSSALICLVVKIVPLGGLLWLGVICCTRIHHGLSKVVSGFSAKVYSKSVSLSVWSSGDMFQGFYDMGFSLKH